MLELVTGEITRPSKGDTGGKPNVSAPRRVPIRIKLIALGIGAPGIGGIELLQLPIEGVLAALLPFLGAAGAFNLDG